MSTSVPAQPAAKRKSLPGHARSLFAAKPATQLWGGGGVGTW